MSIWTKLAGIFLVCGIAFAQTETPQCSSCAAWNAPQTPFRIYGNTYYVGPHGLSSILITSDSGHILIDGGLAESAQQIAAHIRELGFRVEDVKLIVNSHVHFDHAGGIAELQSVSGARVVASPWSAQVMSRTGLARDDPQFGVIRPIALVKNVQVLTDGESFRVGTVTVTAHFTPGHTPGGTSWTWKSCDGNNCLNLVYADSLTPVSADGFEFTTDYANSVHDFKKSFAFLRSTDCDILLTTHPDASDLWGRLDARGHGSKPDPIVDKAACRNLADSAEESFNQRIASETQ